MVSFLSHNDLSHYGHESQDRTLPYNFFNPNNLDLIYGQDTQWVIQQSLDYSFVESLGWSNPSQQSPKVIEDKCAKCLRGAFGSLKDETINPRDYYFNWKSIKHFPTVIYL